MGWEVILWIEVSRARNKKYCAVVHSRRTGKTRRINFGDTRYGQYKDQTRLRAYAGKDHGDPARRRSYFKRHSGVSTKAAALRKERARGVISAKLLSHTYLW